MPERMPEGNRKIYGMVHLDPLPGTPYYEPESFARIRDKALQSALALDRGGAHGCLVQTVDRVYPVEDAVDPARVVAMGLIVNTIAEAVRPGFAIGVQIMKNAIEASLAVAKVGGGHFIRATALVGKTLSDHGTLNADPYGVAAYRQTLCAHDIDVVADIASIHHRPSRNVGELARHACRVGANAVAVGSADESRTLAWLAEVRRKAPALPVFLAGHTDHDNAARLLSMADGAFVGACLETNGWGSGVDSNRVAAYMEIVNALPPLKYPCTP
ncbi:hypothetical protein CDG76_35175 [Nostoc sp. 'Peltigera membranacea cyanobiont' 210A]|uniref:BtpA/SgcQ family protein n=1 Tax=Nostoc sp. 'Peltigera membranacea cyanobiont' 210A TaxID=2014529 RepID=UPI000B9508E3|nr:BtpA/SgcQ family protein [Nostoc sp. 'Peltigera membranacea cyanobiont' 210A]OYD89388.1 hypothetical protein CDG76_35175 [Nostoc sp. 'Peltigera membranacea cyanobiont' 210A]